MLHYQPRAIPGSGARLGMVIGKKLLRRAVDRNRVKRCIRECFRLRRADLPACDLIVRLIARPATVSGKAIVGDLQALLDKLPRRLRSFAEGG
jgi:ribonuclease P protein component